jgi:regulator of protease activity HflC (stomatin/prohibitin superfamily)
MALKQPEKKLTESLKEKIKEKGFLIAGLVLLLIIISFINGWLAFLLFLAIVFFPKLTIVEEGTVKIVVRLGQYSKSLISWRGHTTDNDGNVIDGNEIHLLGGLRFAGFYWIDDIYQYKFRWLSLELVDGQEKIVFHEKELDYIFVRPDVYPIEQKGSETKPPERIALDNVWLVTIRVVNPYKALFRAPSNWNENVLSKLEALLRGWVGMHDFDEILNILGTKKSAPWDDLKGEDLLVEKFEKEWGIKIEEKGIEIKKVTPPKHIEEAASRQRQQELEAAGTAAATVGSVIAQMSVARGKTQKEIQVEIEKDENLKREFLDIAKDLTIRQMGIKGKAYVDIRVPEGTGGLEKTILEALAAFTRMPNGVQSSQKSSQKGSNKETFDQDNEEGEENGGKKKKRQDMTFEESKKEFDSWRDK